MSEHQNGSSPPLPAATRPDQRSAAAQRRAAYPYMFPGDQRKLGGKFSVQENSRRLLRFFYFERRLMQGIGSWTLAIPDFEVKIETGRHLFWHADAAKLFRERLTEQEMRYPAIDGHRDAEIDEFIDEILSAHDTAELLVGVHQVVGRALEVAYRHHIDNTCPVADAPTIRTMRHVLLDYEPMLAWAEQAITAYVEGGVEESRLESWRWHLERMLSSIGGATGVDERGPRQTYLRTAARSYTRGTVPCRDGRFATFIETGDYGIANRVLSLAVMKISACASFALSAMRWTPSRRSVRSYGISDLRISMPSTLLPGSPGTKRATPRSGTRPC